MPMTNQLSTAIETFLERHQSDLLAQTQRDGLLDEVAHLHEQPDRKSKVSGAELVAICTQFSGVLYGLLRRQGVNGEAEKTTIAFRQQLLNHLRHTLIPVPSSATSPSPLHHTALDD